MGGQVHECSSVKDFDDKIAQAAGKLVVVDFYADWCGPCKNIAPEFVNMSNEFSDVVFLKVNVDELDEIAHRFEVRAMPTFLFLRDGTKKDSVVGANKDQLRSKLQTLK